MSLLLMQYGLHCNRIYSLFSVQRCCHSGICSCHVYNYGELLPRSTRGLCYCFPFFVQEQLVAATDTNWQQCTSGTLANNFHTCLASCTIRKERVLLVTSTTTSFLLAHLLTSITSALDCATHRCQPSNTKPRESYTSTTFSGTQTPLRSRTPVLRFVLQRLTLAASTPGCVVRGLRQQISPCRYPAPSREVGATCNRQDSLRARSRIRRSKPTV